ncbi:translocon-associated protein beta (TRAPB) family protein [Wolffia australiana]
MAIARSGAIVVLFAAFLIFSSVLASSDSPFLVVHKKADLSRPKSGTERISVAIDVYNQGSGTAYDVVLTDDSWENGAFELVSGSSSKSWEKLETGSIVSHSFVLESKVKGLFQGAPAVVKFRVPSKSALQEAYSTPVLPLDILADKPPLDKLNWVSSSLLPPKIHNFRLLLLIISILG